MTEYAERDAQALDRAGGHYCRHINAMTAEKLTSKGDIAAELAWRDMCVADLTAALEMQNLRCAELQAHCLAVAKRCKELEAQLVSADRYTLHALAGAGICTPAEGFRKAGFNWAARGIEELVKQRDEALARVAELNKTLDAEAVGTGDDGQLLIPHDPRLFDFDRSEEATE